MGRSKTEQIYFSAFKSGLTPEQMLDFDKWADEHIVLAARNAAEPGPYRIARAPYWIEVAKCLSPSSPVQKVVVMKSAQVGFSQLGFNWLAFCAATTPAPILLVQPTTELAERVSKQRIASMIDETPILKELVSSEKSRSTGNTILLKEFSSGAILLITGANSPVGLRSMPCRFIFMDETSAYPADVGGEGSAISLAEKRAATFKRRKILIGSTPTIADADITESEFLQTDQRRYFVPCPHCGGLQWLKWRQVEWTDGDPATAKYRCEHCEELIEERHKREMLEGGSWQATAPFDGKTAGFHISALYSPWMTWAEIVDEFLKSKNDAPRLKTWTNTILGETFHEEYSAKLGASELEQRAEPYKPGTAPDGVVVVTAGVDVQNDRLCIQRVGWGRDEESWVLDYQEIYGDPGRAEVWKQLEVVLNQSIPHETQGDLKVRAACIDSGHMAHEVYAFARQHRARHWVAIKGQSQKNKPVIQRASKVDFNAKGMIYKNGAEVYPVGVDTAKSTIYSRLKHNAPGPGYIHFHTELDAHYYDMLTSERQQVRYVKGFPVREWVKQPGKRNESLDTFVYAFAALHMIAMSYNRATFWDQMVKLLRPKSAADASETKQSLPDTKKQTRIGPIKRGFVTSW